MQVGLEALRRTLARTDQAGWADRLAPIESAVGINPERAARAALRLFEPPDNLDDLVLSYAGRVHVVDDDRLWRWNREFAEARSALYQAALPWWLEVRTVSQLPVADGAPAQKLLDYGYGSEVWRVGDRYLARRDVGGLQTLWREDEIYAAEAEQAGLGVTHFNRMCLTLALRLQAGGVDSYRGSPTPLADPG